MYHGEVTVLNQARQLQAEASGRMITAMLRGFATLLHRLVHTGAATPAGGFGR